MPFPWQTQATKDLQAKHQRERTEAHAWHLQMEDRDQQLRDTMSGRTPVTPQRSHTQNQTSLERPETQTSSTSAQQHQYSSSWQSTVRPYLRDAKQGEWGGPPNPQPRDEGKERWQENVRPYLRDAKAGEWGGPPLTTSTSHGQRDRSATNYSDLPSHQRKPSLPNYSAYVNIPGVRSEKKDETGYREGKAETGYRKVKTAEHVWTPAEPRFLPTNSRYEFDDTPDFAPPMHVQFQRELAKQREREALGTKRGHGGERKVVEEAPTLKLKRCGCCGLQHTSAYKKLDGGVNPCGRKKCRECEK